MGIKSLNEFLRKECPGAFIELPVTFFRGKRIAIDSDNILYKFKSRAHKEIVNKTDVCVMEPNPDEVNKRWVFHVKNFTADLLKAGATPVFVFDGAYIDEKSITQQKRKADKNKLIDNSEILKQEIMELDELERTPSMVTELRKKMHHLGFLTSDDKQMMMGILSGAGFPVLKATGEGEQLCAMLCIEGKVDAVYSRDTDLVAFGCPLTINEPSGYIYNKETGRSEESLKCTVFLPILSALGITYETFRDLCIMSGCDFNSNIPHLGVKKAYEVLKLCKAIENLPQKFHVRATCKNMKHTACQVIKESFEDQTECLNHVRSREILGHHPSETICQDPINLNIGYDYESSRDRLEMFGAEDWISDIIPLFSSLPVPSNIFISKIPTLARSSIRLELPKTTKLLLVDPTGSPLVSNNIPLVSNNVPSSVNIGSNTTLGVQKSSPQRINNKIVNQLSNNQHQRFLNKHPELKSVEKLNKTEVGTVMLKIPQRK